MRTATQPAAKEETTKGDNGYRDRNATHRSQATTNGTATTADCDRAMAAGTATQPAADNRHEDSGSADETVRMKKRLPALTPNPNSGYRIPPDCGFGRLLPLVPDRSTSGSESRIPPDSPPRQPNRPAPGKPDRESLRFRTPQIASPAPENPGPQTPIRRAGNGICNAEGITKILLRMYFLWYLLIGLVAGWLANLLFRGRGAGLFVNLIVGIIGGVLGGWLLSLFGLIPVGTLGSLITSVVGAVVLLALASLIVPRDTRK